MLHTVQYTLYSDKGIAMSSNLSINPSVGECPRDESSMDSTIKAVSLYHCLGHGVGSCRQATSQVTRQPRDRLEACTQWMKHTLKEAIERVHLYGLLKGIDKLDTSMAIWWELGQ